MSFDFVEKVMCIGGTGNEVPTLQFYKKGFRIGSGKVEPTWRDIILHGNTALTLVNAKAESLEYLKLFGGTEQLSETYLDSVTLSGGCEQNGTPTPTTPVDIVCNNGVVKVSKNLFDYEYFYDNYQIFEGTSVGRCPIKLKPNTTYTVSTNKELSASTALILVVSGSAIDWTPSTANNGVLINSPRTVTTNSNGYLCLGIYVRGNNEVPESEFISGATWVQIEEGSTATSYMPYGQIYVDGTQEVVTDNVGNTASAERLLAVGSYKDTQEVLTGAVTRNVNIVVFNGSESWSKDEQFPRFILSTQIMPKTTARTLLLYCTHFGDYHDGGAWGDVPNNYLYNSSSGGIHVRTDAFADVTEWTTFLAQQYANGTPVILVCPSITATTSTVTGQFLSKSPVTQTAGAISGLTITTTESAHTVPTPQQPLPINCNNGVIGLKNILDVSKSTRGYYINKYTGAIESSANWSVSDYLPVTPNSQIVISGLTYMSATAGFNYYNSSKTLVSTIPYAIGNNSYTVPNNASYIRICYRWADDENTVKVMSGLEVIGTTETVEITGKNLFNKNGNYVEGYVSGTDHTYKKVDSNIHRSFCIPCLPNTTYTLSGMSSPWGSFTSNTLGTLATVYTTNDGTITTGPNDKYLIGIAYTTSGTLDNRDTLQIELGSTATTYEPYFNGGTATAQNLFKVGTYQDVQSVIDGGVTRNVGIKVLDGTENWYVTEVLRNGVSRNDFFTMFDDAIATGTDTIICSIASWAQTTLADYSAPVCRIPASKNFNIIPFEDTTTIPNIASWKQWLADQYANGTPVIIVYPLAEATTETVTAQPMNIQEGTNNVTITQASTDDLELEVKYKAGVSVTITEIENANLDNNVEVTING